MSEIVFNSTNQVGTLMTYKKTDPLDFSDRTARDHIGTCTALSALWLKNMISQLPPAATKPPEFQAALIQTKLMQQWNGDLDAFSGAALAAAGLKPADEPWDFPNFYKMLNFIHDEQGYYFINLKSGHVIAAVTRGDRGADCFLYDSNTALWQFKASVFVMEAIQKIGMGGYYDNGCRVQLVAADT